MPQWLLAVDCSTRKKGGMKSELFWLSVRVPSVAAHRRQSFWQRAAWETDIRPAANSSSMTHQQRCRLAQLRAVITVSVEKLFGCNEGGNTCCQHGVTTAELCNRTVAVTAWNSSSDRASLVEVQRRETFIFARDRSQVSLPLTATLTATRPRDHVCIFLTL